MTAASRTAAAMTTAPRVPRPRRAITAAAQRINITTASGRKLIRKPDSWQAEAWAFFKVVSGVTFAGGFVGNALSRVRPFPGVVLDPDEPVVSLADAAEVEGSGITAELAAAAEEEFARLASASDGIAGLMRGFGVNLAIAGEAYLVGRPPLDDDPMQEERWGVYSSSAISATARDVRLKETSKDKGELLADDTFIARVWRRDPEWAGEAWSNMRSVLGECEELVIWGRVFRAVAKSAANGGILTMPSEMDLEALARAGDPDADLSGMTELQRSYLEHVTQSIETDDTASAAAPWVLDGGYEYLDRVKWIDTTRRIDERALDRIDALDSDLAHGLDLPIEVVKGIGDLNHWSGWLVSDDTWKAHLEPTGQVIAHGIASAFLRPGLVDQGFPVEQVRRVVVGLDPSTLVGRPNRSEEMNDAHDRVVISDAYYRQEKGIPESAAPSDEEVAARLERSRARRGGGVQDGAAPEDGGDPVPSTQPAAAGLGPQLAIEGRLAPDASLASSLALTAAAGTEDEEDPWEALTLLLLGIESTLMVRLQVAASDDLADALRVAGNRLRSRVQHNAEARSRVSGVAPEDVPRALGPELVAELADVDWLLDGAFGTLRQRWDAWVSAAQAQVADLFERVAASAPDPGAAGDAVAAYRRQAEADREAGWGVLAALLLGFARDRLWSSAPELIQGEADPTVSVPAGLVRDALARAGGGEPGRAPVGSAQHDGPAGLTTSGRVRTLFDALGATVVAWQWSTGMPANPFEPHQRLDGVVFDRWDDERLRNPGSFPGGAYLAPGDHRGCQCSAVPVVVTLARPRRDAA